MTGPYQGEWSFPFIEHVSIKHYIYLSRYFISVSGQAVRYVILFLQKIN